MLTLVSSGYGSATRQAPHTHDELQISMVLRGTVEERVGASVERASALSVVVKDPGVVHADDFGTTGALTAQLKLHNTTLSELVEHPERARVALDARCEGRGSIPSHRGARPGGTPSLLDR